jgi:hypothetical protein
MNRQSQDPQVLIREGQRMIITRGKKGAKIASKNEAPRAHTVTSDEGKGFDAVADGGRMP